MLAEHGAERQLVVDLVERCKYEICGFFLASLEDFFSYFLHAQHPVTDLSSSKHAPVLPSLVNQRPLMTTKQSYGVTRRFLIQEVGTTIYQEQEETQKLQSDFLSATVSCKERPSGSA